MKKTIMAVAAVTLVAFVSISLLANPKVNKAHAPLKSKDGKAINCGYCHGPIAKKKDQQMLKGQAKYKDAAKIPACTGAGCHK